jgi:hypothetical protein
MPTINITSNTGIDLTASCPDPGATLNRYLKNLLTFKAPPSFDPLSNLLVKDQLEKNFPISVSATGEGTFAVEKTTLAVQLGASASVGLLQGEDEAAFLSSLEVPFDPTSAGLVSFGVQGALTVGPAGTFGDFTFGITHSATVSLTSYYAASSNDQLVDAVKKAVAALTIPHHLNDLNSLPAGAICQVDARGSLVFSASFSYSFLNDPLAAASIEGLPSLGINATALATIEATVTHTSDHKLTIAKLPTGLLHLSVSLTKTDDFETSLTVSAGVSANIGSRDALAFLLDKINPNTANEADSIAAQMKDAAQFKSDIKAAIDTSLSASLAISLKAALETSKSKNRAFLFEIDLSGLDDASKLALQAALRGDFTAMTKAGAPLSGIKQLDSALTVTSRIRHTFALHFLGIFNSASINEFVKNSKIDFTSDTHELVLSDERLQVVENNLNAEKLRQLILKDTTLTLPASANTKDVKTPIALAFLDREGSTNPGALRQFVNVLQLVKAPSAAAAQALLDRRLSKNGTCALFLGLNLDPTQCRQLFFDADGKPFDFMHYINARSAVEKAMNAGLADDQVYAFRLRLFNASQEAWKRLQEAGVGTNMTPILRDLGVAAIDLERAVTDAMTAIWWSEAMADYAATLAKGQSLEKVGRDVVKKSNLGYEEPWMILTTWNLAGSPAITSNFVSSVPAVNAAAK